jgi:hypothetical protein
MLLSLFLSCIVTQASTPILYRSSKIILCVALLAFLFLVTALLKIRGHISISQGAGLFLLALGMSLSDRQGFYYLISATVAVLMLWSFAKVRQSAIDRPYVHIALINVAAIAAVIFYNRLLAPKIIHALNGYWPSFAYQNLPWSKLFDSALPAKAFFLFQQQVSFFFGNIPFVLLFAIVLVAILGLVWKKTQVIKTNLDFLAISLLCAAAIFGLLAAMVARHPAVYSVRDHSFWYYTLTVHVVILFGISA